MIFQYLVDINYAEQIHFTANIWQQIRTNYWKCTSSCDARLPTTGSMHGDLSLKDANKLLPQHRGHDPVSNNEYMIRHHLT